ncbi:MAG: hypothetical protein KatS3mg027_0605 [Bacteroidia bacterium]|nr:MAG: hypothetical protein KatS3mg027_0605 [Bacteroidia bacterium]
MKNNNLYTLKQAHQGEKLVIKSIKDSHLKNYLGQIGIFTDQEIIVTKIAPFGSMIAVLTNDTEIAIRKEVAEVIEVQSL